MLWDRFETKALQRPNCRIIVIPSPWNYRDSFDRKRSNTSTRRWDQKERRNHAEKNDCEDKKINRCKKKANSHEKDCYAKKKAKRRQSNQRIKKNLEIEESLSSSTSKFFRFSVFVFANERNCVWIREIDSSNREKRSRQLCVIDERLYVSINEFSDEFFREWLLFAANEIKKWRLNVDYRWVETSAYFVSRWWNDKF